MGIVTMADEEEKNSQFSSLAVEMNFIDQERVDKALVVQSRIFKKTNVLMFIGDILVEMGAIDSAQRDEINGMIEEIENQAKTSPAPPPASKINESRGRKKKASNTFDITVLCISADD